LKYNKKLQSGRPSGTKKHIKIKINKTFLQTKNKTYIYLSIILTLRFYYLFPQFSYYKFIVILPQLKNCTMFFPTFAI